MLHEGPAPDGREAGQIQLHDGGDADPKMKKMCLSKLKPLRQDNDAINAIVQFTML